MHKPIGRRHVVSLVFTGTLIVLGVAATGAASLAPRPGDQIVAERAHILNDGTGRVAFPDSPGVYLQAFDDGVTPALTPITQLENAVELREITLSPAGAVHTIVFDPRGGIPAPLAAAACQLKALRLAPDGSIAGVDFFSASDAPACATVFSPQPDGTIKVYCNDVDCNGTCELLVTITPAGGFSVTCACRETGNPTE